MSFAEAAMQIKKNHKWLEESEETEKKLQETDEFYSNAIVVKGVTQGIKADIRKVREATDENDKQEDEYG